jgi:uncharacterized protein YdhG (YjbR/CyaY superfamily)
MQSKANTPDEYIDQLPVDRKEAITKLRKEVLKNLPKGFKEVIGYGMISYVVPHDIYPAGYHCKPSDPLPFASLASQKNFISLYHMGIYSDPALMDWFMKEYPKHTIAKLDMGKSCIRFKKPEQIPFKLFGELMSKMTVDDWIGHYELVLNKSKTKK